MTTIINGRVIKIGNSQGIRIPKLLLEQSGIKEHVKIEVRDGQITIAPADRAREGWEEAFAAMEKGDYRAEVDASRTETPRDHDVLLDEVTGTAWDEEEWEW
jgi:antitoxin MazE